MRYARLFLIFAYFISVFTYGQRKTTYVHSYYRKDGTYVSGYTRHTTGNGRYSYGNIGSGEYAIDIEESTLKMASIVVKPKIKRISNFRIFPTTLSEDTTGISVLVGVLRYHDSTVVDICPLPRSILTYDVDDSPLALLFKIPKDKLLAEDVIELVSKYDFELKEGFLRKQMYLGIGKNELPKFMSLKIESLTLK